MTAPLRQWMRSRAGPPAIGVSAAICAATVIALSVHRQGFFYVYLLPGLSLLAGVAAIGAGSRFAAGLAAVAAAASAGLLAFGWGIPLTVTETEAAVGGEHPGFGHPILCHPVSGGGLLAQRYDCSWRGSLGGMSFDVNDSRIVAEYP